MAQVSIYTIAKELNMTPSMVSRAFTPGARIDCEKRRKVLETAQKYNYVPNKFASRLSGREVRIGVLINSRFKVNTDIMIESIKKSHELLKNYKIGYEVKVLNPTECSMNDYKNTLSCYSDFDGVILTGMSSDKYTGLINNLYEKNKNIVQVQSINENANYLFGSKHDEKTASSLAAEFLFDCLRFCDRKKVVMFIGNTENSLHASAKEAFVESCRKFGLEVVGTYNMNDDEKCLEEAVVTAFKEHDDITGIYTTSGISKSICQYLENNSLYIPFVGFDIHSDVKEYIEKGIMTASIYQNVGKQMQTAFEKLVMHIIDGQECEKVVCTDVQIVFKSNINKYI